MSYLWSLVTALACAANPRSWHDFLDGLAGPDGWRVFWLTTLTGALLLAGVSIALVNVEHW